jgi:hypothetical protein
MAGKLRTTTGTCLASSSLNADVGLSRINQRESSEETIIIAKIYVHIYNMLSLMINLFPLLKGLFPEKGRSLSINKLDSPPRYPTAALSLLPPRKMWRATGGEGLFHNPIPS